MSTQTEPGVSRPGEDVLTDHNYDGIQEYDNPMPGWWKWTFYITIVWSVIYVLAIGVGEINSYEDDLAEGRAELESIRARHQRSQPQIKIDAATLTAALAEPGRAEAGQPIFVEKCGPCHGNEGQGLIGPNLTDDHWLYGGALTSIFTSVKDGIPAKGMPPWGPQLTQDEIISVVAHIRAIRGSNPAGAKPAQGEPYDPSQEAAGDKPAGDAPAGDAPAGDAPATP